MTLDTALDAEPVDLLAGVRSGAWLDVQTFPALTYAVQPILAEGLTLLAGSPKAGKSWLVLDWLLAVASTRPALGGLDTGAPRRVLYLALEDGMRRLQDRSRQLLDGVPIPERLDVLVDVAPTRILHTIEAWLDANPSGALVVLDTLGKAMPPAANGETTYDRDYRFAGRIKRMCASRPGLAIVAVHHTRKAASSDFVDAVSGTNGLAGAADSILTLERDRHSDAGLLRVTGRDVIEDEYALVRTGPAWALLDGSLDAARAAATQQRHAMQASGLSPDMQAVLDFVNTRPTGVTPRDVDEALGMRKARTYLGRLLDHGLIDRAQRGLYLPVATVAALQREGDTATLATPTGDGSEW